MTTSGLAHNASLPTIQRVYDGRCHADALIGAFSQADQYFPCRDVVPAMPELASLDPLQQAETLLDPDSLRWDEPLVQLPALASAGSADLAQRLRDLPCVPRDVYDHTAHYRVAGLLVLKRGQVVLEHYDHGLRPDTRWLSMSVAKSVTSTLAGCALHQGLIGSLDDPLTDYMPALRQGAYAGVTLRHLLTMTSGAGWDETYTQPGSHRRAMLALQLQGRPGDVVALMASLQRVAEPGARWNYSTGETHLLGAVVAAAIRRAPNGTSLAHYLSDRIWSRCGMQSSARWWLESEGGLEVGGSGLMVTLRDYARLGLFAMRGGTDVSTPDAQQLVPSGWFDLASTPLTLPEGGIPYGFMWWTPEPDVDGTIPAEHHGAFLAAGIFGQFLYVNPHEQVVIVQLGAWPKPVPVKPWRFFAAVVKALRDDRPVSAS